MPLDIDRTFDGLEKVAADGIGCSFHVLFTLFQGDACALMIA
jgi:hypothetical protein